MVKQNLVDLIEQWRKDLPKEIDEEKRFEESEKKRILEKKKVKYYKDKQRRLARRLNYA